MNVSTVFLAGLGTLMSRFVYATLAVALALMCPLVFPSEAQAEQKTIIRGANLAYYFDDNDKLLVIENMDNLPREIVIHAKADRIDSWGLTLVNNSSCGNYPTVTGTIGIPREATKVVYVSVGPSSVLVLGIEDPKLTPPTEPPREIVTLQPDIVGACCCTRIPCNGKLCCPPGCPTSC